MKGIIQSVAFCVWPLLLSIVSSRSMHTVACVSVLFFFMVECSSLAWVRGRLDIHSSVRGCWMGACFSFLALVSGASHSPLCL